MGEKRRKWVPYLINWRLYGKYQIQDENKIVSLEGLSVDTVEI